MAREVAQCFWPDSNTNIIRSPFWPLQRRSRQLKLHIQIGGGNASLPTTIRTNRWRAQAYEASDMPLERHHPFLGHLILILDETAL